MSDPTPTAVLAHSLLISSNLCVPAQSYLFPAPTDQYQCHCPQKWRALAVVPKNIEIHKLTSFGFSLFAQGLLRNISSTIIPQASSRKLVKSVPLSVESSDCVLRADIRPQLKLIHPVTDPRFSSQALTFSPTPSPNGFQPQVRYIRPTSCPL